MAFDPHTVERIRAVLAPRATVDERHMFGGIAFMLGDHMCCGLIRDELIVRLGPELGMQALTEPFTRPMDITGRPMTGMVIVAAPGFAADESLASWVERGLAYASSLPPKNPRSKPTARRQA